MTTRDEWVQQSRIPGRTAYLWIYDEWLASNPRQGAIVVENGVALGKSIAYLATRCAELGRYDIQIYAVDPWAGTAQNGEQQTMARDAGGDFSLYAKTMLEHAPAAFERVRVVRAEGEAATRLFRARDVDLVILDGAHDELSVGREIVLWMSAIRWDGWIGGDDYHEGEYPGVVRSVERLFRAPSIEVRREHDWPTWLVRTAAAHYGLLP